MQSMHRTLATACLTLMGFVASLALAGSTARSADAPTYPATTGEPLPPGVVVQTVLSGLNAPVAMAFDPEGRLFFTQLTGEVRLYANGVLQPDPVITFTGSDHPIGAKHGAPTCIDRRLLGIEVDPNFSANHYIYVYLTEPSDCAVAQNKVIRFVESNGTGSDPTVIFSSPQTAEIDQGGNIHFGPDGKLYISVGHDANAATAQDVTVKPGKMHRINADGTTPPDNPVFTQTGALPSLYALGLRNTFDFTFDTVAGARIFAGDNGPNCDDELNRIVGGYNYGWRPDYPCDDADPDPTYNSIPPMWYRAQSEGSIAPTGVEVYTGTNIQAWQNGLFMCSYNDGALRHFYLSADRTRVTSVSQVQGVTCNMDVETGPDGALYYIEGGGYPPGNLKRIVALPIAACDILTGSIYSSPNMQSPYNALRDVAALSASDIWAVGHHSDPATPWSSRTLIEHWDGLTWSIIASPNPVIRDNLLLAISAVSPGDIWAVGFYTDPDDLTGDRSITLTMHWDGQAWSVIPSPNIATDSNFLHDVEAISSDDVWAVGYSGTAFDGETLRPLTLHWNGTQWDIIPTPNIAPNGNARLVAVDAASATDLWAVGDYSLDGSSPLQTLIMRWDGTAWSVRPSPNAGPADSTLRGVAVATATDAWAVGYYGPSGSGQTLTLHWDGTQWSLMSSPNPGDSSFLTGVDAPSADNVWAVGNYFTGGIPKTLAMRWTGSEWSTVSSANAGAEGSYIDAVDVLYANEVWGVGNYTSGSNTLTLVERFTPALFSDVPPDSTFYAFVQCLSCRGVISGYDDGTFRPFNDITRGQIAKVVSNAAGFDEDPGPQIYEDVPADNPFYQWINRLSMRGHMGGYPCGTVAAEPCIQPDNRPYFRPFSNATRGQLAKIVANAGGVGGTPAGLFYTDVQEDNPFYLWIMRLTELGVMGGYDCGGEGEPCDPENRPYFRPFNNVTRGQASKIVANTFFPDCQTLSKR